LDDAFHFEKITLAHVLRLISVNERSSRNCRRKNTYPRGQGKPRPVESGPYSPS
jgi:hypothetical protein